MRHTVDAILQIDSVERECIDVLGQVVKFCVMDNVGHRPDIFRLMAVPMIYSAWERAFRISTAVAIRHLVENAPTVAHLSADQKALLLQRESFFKSFSDKKPLSRGARGPGKGEFETLSDLLAQFDIWSFSKANLGTDAEEYVMTFSNVDHNVLRLHEKILGAGLTVDKSTGLPIDLAPLGELLNRRNDISHGGSMQPPGEKNLDNLFEFANSLVTSYCDSMRAVVRRNSPTHSVSRRFRGYQLNRYRHGQFLRSTIYRRNQFP